jgi:hypothetical protein
LIVLAHNARVEGRASARTFHRGAGIPIYLVSSETAGDIADENRAIRSQISILSYKTEVLHSLNDTRRQLLSYMLESPGKAGRRTQRGFYSTHLRKNHSFKKLTIR